MISIVQGLYARGYKRKEIHELLRFIDWVMAQSPLMEEVEKMRYMMSIERLAIQEGIELGMEEGLEQGLEQGKLETTRENALEILALRFKTVPQDLIDFINNLTNLQQLKLLLRHAATQGTLEEFEQFVETEINV